MKNKNIVTYLFALAVGLFLGWIFFGGSEESQETNEGHEVTGSTEWTCSMHPEVRSHEDGSCPICGMALIPIQDGDSSDRELFHMTTDAMKLANIQTRRVEKELASRELRLNGKVVADERSTYSQSTHIPGRIEELRIAFTGESVRKGQTLAVVYSPELLTAQEELLQAYKIREQQPALYAAIREKLGNWRIGEAQLDKILSTGKALRNFPISADVSGVVTEKLVDVGDYVERGMPLYTVSDLSKVWVLFDLYESQLAWVKAGNSIEFSIASLPGETFKGEVTFIDPVLNNETRVATARLEVDNSDYRLKPGMFASGILDSGLGERDAEEVILPKSAVLWTGKRSLVYVKEQSGERVGFRLREVVLGPALGDSYVIEEGLSEGEEVVVNGTFTVDAAVQLSGRASMMNPDKGRFDAGQVPIEEKEDVSPAFQEQLEGLLNAYFELKDALVEAEEGKYRIGTQEFQEHLQQMESQELKEGAGQDWQRRREALENAIERISRADGLEDRRLEFRVLSEEMIKTISRYGSKNRTIFVNYCPMANSDQGAYWLSGMREIRNPYYGEAMLSCGEIVKEIN